MKKLTLLLLCAVFLLAACGAENLSLNPAGVPQALTPAAETEDAPTETDDYEYYLEHIQIKQPAAVIYNEDSSVLRLSMRHPQTLNPLLNEDVTVARILRLIFEPLIILDEHLQPSSHLAEVEFTPDFSSATVSIRNDAFWSDGTPVTSDDLIFSIDTLRGAPPNAIYRRNVENISVINRVNSRTAQIRFHHPSPTAGVDLNFPIIPRHHYQGQGQVQNSMNPLGNASFLFESYSPMNHITLVQNPTSFRPLSHIQNIKVIFLPDAQTEIYAFDQGRIDAIYLPLTEWVRHHSVRHPNYEIFPAMYFEFIGFNFHNEIFDNLHMRQGVAHAFNANEVTPAVYLTHAVRAASPIHPSSFTAASAPGIAHDLARARTLLNAVDVDRPLVIIVNGDNPQRISIAQRLAASLNAVGMPAHTETLHHTDYFTRLESGDFDLFIGGMNLAWVPDVSVFFEAQDGFFFAEDTVLQASFTNLQNAVTQANYAAAMAQFQADFAEQLPVISLVFRHSAVLTSTRITQNRAPAPDNIWGWVNLWQVE